MNHDDLRRLLDLLKESNVEYYSVGPGGFQVKFRDSEDEYETFDVRGFAAPEREDEERPEPPIDRYHHPSLWRDGKPPAFPTR